MGIGQKLGNGGKAQRGGKVMMPYESAVQQKNMAWFLPRPKPDHYKGGLPLHCEKWLLLLAKNILQMADPFICNVFCGMNTEGIRVDIKEEVNPDICCDVHQLSHFVEGPFDIILADPPYSNKEAEEIYGTPKLRYKEWAAECDKVLRPGGLLIVYHKYVMPNPNPKKYSVAKRVFIGNRSYHIPRVAIYFIKNKD
jgi:16S rRNA G966 N2-methylase RsmD